MSNIDIQKTELWDVASQLIRFDTVSAKSNLEAAQYLANYLEDAGLTVQILTDYVQGVKKASVLAWAGPQIPGGLILSGHTDVVPFEGQPGWKTDALEMQFDGNRIYGRGVADMKVFLAQAMVAAKKYAHTNLKHPFMLIFTYDEEIGCRGAGSLVKSLPRFFQDYPMPEYALIGEPTDFEIVPAHKGGVGLEIRIQGRGGHSSLPHKGLNAIDKMADVIQLIRETDRNLKQHTTQENIDLFEFPYSSLSCGVINGGLAGNMIADTCKLLVGLRVMPGDDADTILANLKERIEREIAKDMRAFAPESGIVIEEIVTIAPLKSPLESKFSQVLSQIMDQPIGRGAPYGTDGGQFQTLGINSYICGPGSLSEAHRPNESLDPIAFMRGQECVERVIQEWCVAEN